MLKIFLAQDQYRNRQHGLAFLTSSNVRVVFSILFSLEIFIIRLSDFNAKVNILKSPNKRRLGRKYPSATNGLTDIYEKQ